MAEAILRSKNIKNVSVHSAAFMHMTDIQSQKMQETLIEEADMPYTSKSRTLSREDVEWADYILTMTESHKGVLLQLFPENQEKIYTLKGFDIPIYKRRRPLFIRRQPKCTVKHSMNYRSL